MPSTPKPSDAADIRIEVDPTVPPGEAELRDGDRVVARIVGLDDSECSGPGCGGTQGGMCDRHYREVNGV